MKSISEFENYQKFSEEEFKNNFDTLFNRVSDGESFIITSEYGSFLMTPYITHSEHTPDNQKLNNYDFDDEVIKIHRDHGDGP
jgi:hypothetical protein